MNIIQKNQQESIFKICIFTSELKKFGEFINKIEKDILSYFQIYCDNAILYMTIVNNNQQEIKQEMYELQNKLKGKCQDVRSYVTMNEDFIKEISNEVDYFIIINDNVNDKLMMNIYKYLEKIDKNQILLYPVDKPVIYKSNIYFQNQIIEQIMRACVHTKDI